MAILATVPLALVGIAPAHADTVVDLPGDWTPESFTKAALANGYELDLITRALHDESVLRGLAVSVEDGETTNTRAATLEEREFALETSGVTVTSIVTTSHYRQWANAFGAVMRKLTVTKRYTPTGFAAVPYNSSYSTYTNGEWGHYVIGLISNQEYYSVEGNRPQGGHTSYYAVNFGDYGGTYTMWVSIKGLWQGTVVKNAGG